MRANYCRYICDALRNLVPFVQFKKRGKHPWRSVTFSKLAGSLLLESLFHAVAGLKTWNFIKTCFQHRWIYNFSKSNTSPWVFFTVFKLYIWYQIARSVSYEYYMNMRTKFQRFALKVQYANTKSSTMTPFQSLKNLYKFLAR